MSQIGTCTVSFVMLVGLGSLSAARVQDQGQKAPGGPSALVRGRIISVSRMPADLDRWILEDLRAWGKYKVSADPEGASLVMEARVPERENPNGLPPGIPQPRRKPVGVRLPGT